MTTQAPILFTPPPLELGRLPFEVREELTDLLACMDAIKSAKNPSLGCRRAAALFAHKDASGKPVWRRGFSPSSLRGKYDNWRLHGWTALVDKAKAGPRFWNTSEIVGLPLEFREWIKRLAEENQRTHAWAWNEVYKIWQTRFDSNGNEYKKIPGYTEWPQAHPTTGYPRGWSRRNLYHHAPDEFEAAAMRQGRATAANFRLPVLTSRVELELLEYVLFDDHEFNLKVNFPGQWKAMRPRGFAAMDILSGSPFAKSFKPTLYDLVEEKKQALTETDMMWFVVHVLCDFGYRVDERGTKFCVEHGTAAIREEFERRITIATGGKVTVERSGKFGAGATASQFEGQSKGNYRFKALIESFFNLLDNALAHLRGQVGKDRLHAPEQMYGIDAYNNKLLKAAAALPAERAAMLKFPVMVWQEFVFAALRGYDAIDKSFEHKLQGWEKLGFVTKEWRLNEQISWQPFSQLLALPEQEQALARAVVENNPLLHRARKLSRYEVFHGKHSQALEQGTITKLPLEAYPILMGREHARPLTVDDDGLFRFEDRDIDSDPLRYLAMLNGRRLSPGETFQCFVNPFSPGALVLCDDDLRCLGICPAYDMPSRNDVEGVKRQIKAQKQWEAAAFAELDLRHVGAAAERAAMHENNGNIIKGRTRKELTAAQRQAAKMDDQTDEILANAFRQANNPNPTEEQ